MLVHVATVKMQQSVATSAVFHLLHFCCTGHLLLMRAKVKGSVVLGRQFDNLCVVDNIFFSLMNC